MSGRGGLSALPGALCPDWPVPPGVVALMSSRLGGVSQPPCDSLNLRHPALPAGTPDTAESVFENQRRFAAALGATPVWLNQVHGARVLRLQTEHLAASAGLITADASISTEPGLACAVLVADCLPVLLASQDGRVVGAAHAGWRGLAEGVLDHTVVAMCDAGGVAPSQIQAWLGPCIGPTAFEVGADVLQAFHAEPCIADQAHFVYRPRADGQPRWRADLAGLARDRLRALGVQQVSGGRWCTVTDASRFFSYRRDAATGRMAAAIARRG